jgi:hypothetical protein
LGERALLEDPERALLEDPEQAFAAYRSEGLGSVVCQQKKHMGPGPWP